jgi:hypothetical protein
MWKCFITVRLVLRVTAMTPQVLDNVNNDKSRLQNDRKDLSLQK